MGLEKLHCLTSAAPRTELNIDLADLKGTTYKYAHHGHSSFSVGNCRTNYRLFITGYTGTCWDPE